MKDTQSLYWLALFAAVVANVISNVAFKVAVQRVPGGGDASASVLALLKQPPLWVGAGFAGLLLGCYLFAIRGVPLGIAYPAVTGLAMVGILLVGSAFLGEGFSQIRVAGVAAVVLGVFLLSRS